jgi:hypothetical protein
MQISPPGSLSRRADCQEELGPEGSISISVRPQACKGGELPDGPIYFTTYLRTAETKDYVALARDVDLRSIVPNAAVVAEIPRCVP